MNIRSLSPNHATLLLFISQDIIYVCKPFLETPDNIGLKSKATLLFIRIGIHIKLEKKPVEKHFHSSTGFNLT
jgi:hypothetical protein